MNHGRMFEWFALAAVLYAACIALRTFGIEPQAQVVLWKLGNVTIAAFVGYWLDRRAFSRVGVSAHPLEQLRRAVMMAAAMLSVALGL